ncbi:ABC transporter transmembrane domain-containing protein [Microbacterium sp. NRRL B-14842]|uniref:ABC transporter transmembrane domain-containing protein n=1 Tax=Microbacterium sp. NRRL B-14842 TaxID=3162881 RepID=UPI003D2ADA43
MPTGCPPSSSADLSSRRRSGRRAHCLVRHHRGQADPGRPAGPAQAHLPAHPAPEPGVHESYTSGRIISRQTSDLDSIKELLDGGLNELVSGVLFGVFTFIALCVWDWQSGLILAIGGVPLFFLMRWFYSRSQLVYRESRVISAKVIVQFVETMTGIRAVKAFRRSRATTRPSRAWPASTGT